MNEKSTTDVPLDQTEHPEVGDTEAQRRQDQNRLDNLDPEHERDSLPESDGLPDAPPPDKQTPQNYESEGGASPDGPVAIT
jgi:hypothetical protein